MVYGLILLNIETSYVYYTSFFSEEGNDSQKRIRTQFIIRCVMNDYILKRQATRDMVMIQSIAGENLQIFNKNMATLVAKKLPDEGSVNFSEGCMTVEDKNLFNTQKMVVWRQVKGYCLILAVEPSENISLASYFVSQFFDNLDSLGTIDDNWSYISEYLEKFLLNGELMFFSTSYSEFLMKNFKRAPTKKN
eukprot:TRINITY_DN10304_c0_g1_i2.p1 TRINITY_DN10304_c0_g1~~TRINITY_DN10304_c0_g1_i2.p1  ORF type:complete len:192 (+),score=18.03 TRINITY_DN10304_c0_g1_i2:142-717(+)